MLRSLENYLWYKTWYSSAVARKTKQWSLCQSECKLIEVSSPIFWKQSTVQSLYNTMFGVHWNGPCYKWASYEGKILQRNYRKMSILWTFSYPSFAKFHGKNLEAKTWQSYIQIHVIMRCVINMIKGLQSIRWTTFMRKPTHIISIPGRHRPACTVVKSDQ